ncbi:hypothetical protein [Streptomyces mexicanus]|uniref:hypothetical protein n=1 Tax=Streptomyces mexicanus TaxID=178566 RepID=UPI003654DDF3
MAHYRITYLDGETETIQADRSEYDIDSRSMLLYLSERPVAWIPQANVRSLARQNDEAVTD